MMVVVVVLDNSGGSSINGSGDGVRGGGRGSGSKGRRGSCSSGGGAGRKEGGSSPPATPRPSASLSTSSLHPSFCLSLFLSPFLAPISSFLFLTSSFVASSHCLCLSFLLALVSAFFVFFCVIFHKPFFVS